MGFTVMSNSFKDGDYSPHAATSYRCGHRSGAPDVFSNGSHNLSSRSRAATRDQALSALPGG
jgi:hypothetical protein